MQKINFQNLPNTTSPLNATNMNLLQDNVEDVFNGDEAMGNIVINDINTKNMIPGWFYGGLEATDGSENDNANSRRTGFIEVDFSTTTNYYVSGMPGSSTSIRHFIAAYNSSYEFLGRTGGNLGSTENLTSSSFTSGTPQGTGTIKYLRVNIYSGATDSSTATIQLEKGSSSTTFVKGKSLGYISGSTANGHYIKYDDGTLIQWNRLEVSNQAISSSYGSSGLYWGQREITYPVAFVGLIPTVLCSQFKWGTSVSWGETGDTTLTTAKLIGIDIASRASGTTTIISWMAIGRWK